MNKQAWYIIILFFIFSVVGKCSLPSRQFTYVSDSIISSSQVSANEDSIYNYLQSGVDAFADGSIVNADINSSANIQSDKLNLTAITQSAEGTK